MRTRMLMLAVAAALSGTTSKINYHEDDVSLSYLRFPINLWMQKVSGCALAPYTTTAP